MGKRPVIEGDRVRRNTPDCINQRIDLNTASSIRDFARRPPTAIEQRIQELNREWDIERLLETNASTLALAGLALGVMVNRRWWVLSGVVMGFLLLHGIQGWCPPLPLLRRFGVRTQSEIDREKLTLKYIRGDFRRAQESIPRERRRVGALVG